MTQINLTEAQRRRLYRWRKTYAHKPAITRRMNAVLMANRHMTARDIATELAVTERAVFKWLRQYREGGIHRLVGTPHPGAPSRATPAYKELLQIILDEPPYQFGYTRLYWSVPLLHDYMCTQSDVQLSTKTLRRLLRSMGYIYGSVWDLPEDYDNPPPEHIATHRWHQHALICEDYAWVRACVRVRE